MPLYLAMTILAFTSVSASAAITVVGQGAGNNVIVPIEQLKESANEEYSKIKVDVRQPNNQFKKVMDEQSSQEVEDYLFKKYGSIEKMLLHMDKLNPYQQSVLRKITINDYMNKSQEIAVMKNEVKLRATERSISENLDMDQVIYNPENIKAARLIQQKAIKAENEPLFEQKINIKTKQIDPTSDQQIVVNTAKDRPTALIFFDSLGTPYPITKTIPKSTSAFTFETVSENQLIISASTNFKQVAGFVFLEGVSQPIPVQYSSNPTRDIDVKLNFILPTISPESDHTVEKLTVSASEFSKTNDPVMYLILNGRGVPKAKQLKIDGLPETDRAYKYKKHIYFRSKSQMKYDVLDAIRLGGWYVYKAHPRPQYWFESNQREVEVSVYE